MRKSCGFTLVAGDLAKALANVPADHEVKGGGSSAPFMRMVLERLVGQPVAKQWFTAEVETEGGNDLGGTLAKALLGKVIDWDKAPSDATHVGSQSAPAVTCWYKEVARDVAPAGFMYWYASHGHLDGHGWRPLSCAPSHAPLIPRPPEKGYAQAMLDLADEKRRSQVADSAEWMYLHGPHGYGVTEDSLRVAAPSLICSLAARAQEEHIGPIADAAQYLNSLHSGYHSNWLATRNASTILELADMERKRGAKAAADWLPIIGAAVTMVAQDGSLVDGVCVAYDFDGEQLAIVRRGRDYYGMTEKQVHKGKMAAMRAAQDEWLKMIARDYDQVTANQCADVFVKGGYRQP